MTDENFPSRTVSNETPGERVSSPRTVSEVPDTVLPMMKRQLVDGSNIVPVVLPGAAAVFPDLSPEVAARIERSVAASRSTGTRRAYSSAWRRFETWCTVAGHHALPAHPATVAAYLVAAADTLTVDGTRAYAAATFGKWIAAIADRHRQVGHDNPCGHEMVRATLAGIRRDYAAAGDRPRNPRAPLLTSDITTIVALARAGVAGWASEVLERRDTALLLMGYAGAFRRSELVGLECRDVRRDRLDGAHVHLRQSKTDQDGTGAVKALPYTANHDSCPVCAWIRWIQVVAAFDSGGRVAVIRTLARSVPFDQHVCRGPVPVAHIGCRCFGRSGRTATCPRRHCPVLRCTPRFAAGPVRLDTPRISLLSWAGTRCGPASSPKRSVMGPTRTRSCVRPDTARRGWSKSTPARTRR